MPFTRLFVDEKAHPFPVEPDPTSDTPEAFVASFLQRVLTGDLRALREAYYREAVTSWAQGEDLFYVGISQVVADIEHVLAWRESHDHQPRIDLRTLTQDRLIAVVEALFTEPGGAALRGVYILHRAQGRWTIVHSCSHPADRIPGKPGTVTP